MHGRRLFRGPLFVDSVIFRVAIYAPRVAVPLALVGAALIYFERLAVDFSAIWLRLKTLHS